MATILNNNLDIPKELLKKAAESALVSSFVDLNTAKVSPLTNGNKTDGIFQSTTHCHKVVIDLVAKSSPEDSYNTSVFIKAIPRSSKIFKDSEKEVKIYEEFLKEVHKRSKSKEILVLPKCYLTHWTEDSVMIFLENLKSSGFQDFDPKVGLDFNHALLAVESLARFHASSYFLRRQMGAKGKGKMEILAKFPYLKGNIPWGSDSVGQKNHKLSPIIANIFEQIIFKIIESDNPSIAFKLRRKIDPAAIFEKIPQILENEKYDNDDFYVTCHGQMTASNLLFKYPINGIGTKEPTQCKIVDLKHVRFAPIASDLTYLLFTSTTGRMREEFEEKLLAFYCDIFEEHLTLRYASQGQELQDFDIEEFHRKLEEQYRRMLEYGFYNSAIVLPLIFTECEVSSASLERFESKERFDKLVKDCLANSELKQRIISIVKQLFKNRVF